MSRIGYTYGSEWHLLRYLGYHRDALNRAVEAAILGGTMLEWLNWRFETDLEAVDQDPPRFLDREVEGLSFLPASLRHNLAGDWPRTGGLPCWDAVGRIRVDGEGCWLIVEAKSHLAELKSTCKAKGRDVGGGREQILATFERLQADLGITVGAEAWMGPYYQFCNRLTFLQLMRSRDIPAKLLFVYFLGDRFPSTRPTLCPGSEGGWLDALEDMYRHTGWTAENSLTSHVHRLFLPVIPLAT